MTVKELIAELQKHDPNHLVYVRDGSEDGGMGEAIAVESRVCYDYSETHPRHQKHHTVLDIIGESDDC